MALTTVPASLSATALTLTTAAQPNITSVGTLTGLTVSGNIAGTLTTAAQTNITSLGTLTTLTVDDITIDGSTISDAADLTLDVGGDIILDADGGDFNFRDGGAGFFTISNSSLDVVFKANQSNEDMLFKGNDGGSEVTALTLDMSEAGAATFNSAVTMPSGILTVGDIKAVGTGGLSLQTDEGTKRLFINDDGKVGISAGGVIYASRFSVGKPPTHTPGSAFTTSPSSFFSEATLGGTTGNSQKIVTFAGEDATNVSGLSLYRYRRATGTNWTTDGFSLRQEVDGTANLYDYINFAGGNVGIGTTSPDGIFHVKTASGVHRSRFESGNNHSLVRLIAGTGSNAGVEFYSGAGNVGNITADSSSNLLFEPGGTALMSLNTNSQLYLPTGRVQARTALMGEVGSHAMFGSNSASEPIAISRDFSISYPDIVISTYGNIGIGTTSPQHYGNYKTLNIEHGGVGSIIQLNGATTNMRHLIQNNNGQMILSADHGAVASNSSIYLKTDGTNRMTVSDTSYPGFVKVNGSAGALVVAAAGITTFYSTVTNQGVGLYQGGAYSSCGAHMEIATDADTGWSPIYINKYDATSSTDKRYISFGVNAYNTDSATIEYNFSTGNFSLVNASDYRIKENVVNYSGGLEKIEAVRVISYDKINRPEEQLTQEGFIAHELQEIIPAAVNGEKDAMKVNEKGETVPDYQMVSKEALVPYLVSAIQELSAKIKELESK